MWRVLITSEFDTEMNKLDNTERQRVNRILNQLKEKGELVGKPLSHCLREKKFGGKRGYYLIYPDLVTALAVGISDKKAQQDIINKTNARAEEYKEFVLSLQPKFTSTHEHDRA